MAGDLSMRVAGQKGDHPKRERQREREKERREQGRKTTREK